MTTPPLAGCRVLVCGRVHPSGLAVLEQAGLQLELISDPGAPIAPVQLRGKDAVLIRYGVLGAPHVAAADRLRVVSRHGVGVDNLPLAELSARGIAVTVVGAVTSACVAEQAIAMLLALTRRVAAYDHAVRNGDWGIRDSLSIGELAGKTLLLLGMGRIGREVARRALAFGMQVWVHDPALDDAACAAAGVQRVADWRARLPEVDVLSVHLPLTAATRGIVGAAELAALKPDAIVINTARGGLVDEAALARELAGRMAAGGAALDTFEQEPPPPQHPLLALPNVVLSPHSATLTPQSAERMGVVAAGNVVAGLEGRLDPALVVNLAALRAAN